MRLKTPLPASSRRSSMAPRYVRLASLQTTAAVLLLPWPGVARGPARGGAWPREGPGPSPVKHSSALCSALVRSVLFFSSFFRFLRLVVSALNEDVVVYGGLG